MALDHYLNIANQYMQARPYLGLIFAFVISFAESLPIIGTIIPGSITMTIIGILVGRSMIPLSMTLFFATIGALAGDIIGFWLGKVFDKKIPYLWPFRKYPKLLTMGEDFFLKHGGKSILIGRFVGPARSTVPLVAGLLKMKWGRFILVATPCAFLWAIAYLLPGVLIGAISLELPPSKTTEFMLIGLAVIIAIWLVFWAIQRFFVYLANTINRTIDRCWAWMNHHHSSKLIIRFITNQYNPDDHHQLTLIFLGTISLLLFIASALCIIDQNGITLANKPIFHLLQSLRSPPGNSFFVAITLLGDKMVILSSMVFVAAGLLILRQWRIFLYLIFLCLITAGSVWLFKHIVASPRPTGLMVIKSSPSFPSGHTTLAVVLYSFLAYFTAQLFRKKWHWLPYILASIAILLIAISRLYLGAHWLTDVIGSLTLGFAILLPTIMCYRRHQMDKPNRKWWVILLISSLLIPWLAGMGVKFHKLRYNYQPYYPKQVITVNDWWSDPHHYLPMYRLNRFGNPIEPFNIQWASQLSTIIRTLSLHGWKTLYLKRNVKNTIGRFTSRNPEMHMPFLAPLYRNQKPQLTLIKHLHNQQRIIELRLWETGIHFLNTTTPLWIGTIDYRIPPEKLLSLKKHHQITLAHGGGLEILSEDVKQFETRIVNIPEKDQPFRIQILNWDGNILIIRQQSKSQSALLFHYKVCSAKF